MTDAPRLVTDATGTHKLKVSLPGGRYQLSLDDRAVILLTDGLGYDLRDTVPHRVVPVIAAMGDAWFPNQRDVDSVIEDLSLGNPLTTDVETTLRTYVTSNYVREWQVDRVLAAAHRVGLNDVSRSDLQISSVDVDLDRFFGGVETDDSADASAVSGTPDRSTEDGDTEQVARTESTDTSAESTDASTESTDPAAESTDAATESDSDPSAGSDPSSEPNLSTDPDPDPSPSTDRSDAPREAFESIPGIGPERAARIADAGVDSLETLANVRPTDLVAVDGISEGTAIVAIEGAREELGQVRPTSEQLAEETGVDSDVFDAALSSLAASGIPGSEAAPTLRAAFGPTVADVDAVTGAQAYFLWEAGYRTPTDLVDATVEELAAVDQLGEKTAPRIQQSAEDRLAEARAGRENDLAGARGGPEDADAE